MCKLEMCIHCIYNVSTGMYHCIEQDFEEVFEDTDCSCDEE